MNEKAKRIIRLRKTIDPKTGRFYTLAHIAERENVSTTYVSELTYPNHYSRKRRRTTMVKSIRQKIDKIISEDRPEAERLASWFRRRMEDHG